MPPSEPADPRPAQRRPPGEEWRFTAEGWRENAKVRLAAVAGRQFGRVRYDQVRSVGVGETTVRRWRSDGYLQPVLPRVYAVGHTAPSVEADLAAAVLYAGPGAMLSHGTAIWWYGLLKYPPGNIVVSSPRRVQSRVGIDVHGRRSLDRVMHRGLPVAEPSQAILDFAATGPANLLRLVLANADYGDLLDVKALQAISGRGVPGSAALKDALEVHLPRLAHTRGENEVLLLGFCETFDFPLPLMNVYLHGWLVDAYWREQRLVVELDDYRGHRTPAQLHSNHQRDMELRARDIRTLRYARDQLTQTPAAVAADIRRYLS